ncbi:MAG: hypothetical protein OEX22_08695 [Cyclobacteriaceae bacterium]|nr:hypothetical protein [Cyclobacteriaceae bacterium]
MRNLLHSLLDYDKKIYFLFLCIITFLLLYIKKEFIESEIAAFEVLQEKGEMGVFNVISTLQYIGIPIVYVVKFTITAFVIWVGCFMFGYKLTYTQLWGIAVVAESIFIVPEFLKIGYFFFFVGDPDYFDLRAFYPFSLLQLFDYSSLPDKWIYPLKSFNIFEIMYWFILVYAIRYHSNKKLKISYYIVYSSYVLFFLLWLVFYVMVYK